MDTSHHEHIDDNIEWGFDPYSESNDSVVYDDEEIIEFGFVQDEENSPVAFCRCNYEESEGTCFGIDCDFDEETYLEDEYRAIHTLMLRSVLTELMSKVDEDHPICIVPWDVKVIHLSDVEDDDSDDLMPALVPRTVVDD